LPTRVNLALLPETEQRSPDARFRSFCRDVSLALGGRRNAGPAAGGHPFDVQIRRLPPGAAVCPFHVHLGQWELFLVLRGEGTVRAGPAREPVRAGDCFIHPPGEAHQLSNTGRDDLEVLIVADNPAVDAFHYPDSNKWGIRPPDAFFRLTPAAYFDGEDESAPLPLPFVAGSYPTAALAITPPATPFARRRVRLEDVPWEEWTSPRGRFRSAGRQVSAALGAVPRAPLTAGGHPFDLEVSRVPPGAAACPFHWHALQWEFYLVTEGTADFRLGDERLRLGPGDAVVAPPFSAHQLANAGDTDLVCLLVADDPPADYCHYPDSGKFGFSQPRGIFRAQEADYFDGEE
jgi:uncharacterized cupin superfamily protein